MSGEPAVETIRSAVGQAIRDARSESGLSMRAFAEQCGVTQPFVSAVERGLSTPSIATLYRMADVLGCQPAALLPSDPGGDITVIRADEGREVPSSDRPGSAIGRVLLGDEERRLELYEYRIAPTDDLDVWYEHPGEVILRLLEGSLRVRFAGRPDAILGPGDVIVHPGPIAHRWEVEGGASVHLFLVIVRSERDH